VWPSLPAQRIVVTTVGRAAEEAAPFGHAPVVVAWAVPHEPLRWFERRPLFGKRVLVTRTHEQAGATAALLRDRGADVVVIPTIEIHEPASREPLDRALGELRDGGYAWVAFTSANGVEHAWKALLAAGLDARAFRHAKIAAIGPATARALVGHGLHPDVTAREFRGEGLADEMLRALGGAKVRVLLARAARARDALPEALRGAGCTVDVVAAYETRPPPASVAERLVQELEHGGIDVVTFTSSSTVDNLCDLLGARAGALLERCRIAAIGPVTAETALARGLRVDVTARTFTVPGLVEALVECYS
jgi:uroporphyrinogen III methyltransferase/synthase